MNIRKVLILQKLKINRNGEIIIVCDLCGKRKIKMLGCHSCAVLKKRSFINDLLISGWDTNVKDNNKVLCPACKRKGS